MLCFRYHQHVNPPSLLATARYNPFRVAIISVKVKGTPFDHNVGQPRDDRNLSKKTKSLQRRNLLMKKLPLGSMNDPVCAVRERLAP
jgi:hypothetical protein